MSAGREGERVGPTFWPLSIFSERGAGVRGFIGTLPRAVAILLDTPVGRAGERAERFFSFVLPPFDVHRLCG